jgi:hypothetical protein
VKQTEPRRDAGEGRGSLSLEKVSLSVCVFPV